MKTSLILKFSLLGLSLFLAGNLQAQAYLYLEEEGGVPDRRWKQEEKIAILLSDGEEEHWEEGYFNGGDSAGIRVNTRYYTFEQIQAVRYARGIVPFLSKASMAASAFFTGIFATNAIINDDRPILTEGQIVLGSGLFVTGAVLHFFRYKVRRMEDGYKFRIIDINTLDQWKRR